LSISKAIQHNLKKLLRLNSRSLSQKNVETSLIERFLYPKYGPGQLWEEVARRIRERGGELHLNTAVRKLYTDGGRVTAVEIYDSETGAAKRAEADEFFSTMPVKELIRGLQTEVPSEVKEVSEGLIYRDFITVGLLLEKLSIKDKDKSEQLIKDNWIYVQEPDLLLGRIQIFNNWSPYLVKEPSKVWLGLEYFCYESDDLWEMSDEEMASFAISELVKIGFISQSSDVLDYTVVKVPKTYPAYFGTYSEFDRVRTYLDKYENLYLIGRNGMHRYNNQDHSMLTAITAVENIRFGVKDKSNIWAVNEEKEYHEEAKPTAKGFLNSSVPKILRQFVGYLFTGGSATVIDVIVFSILVSSGLWYVAALGVSFVFGVSTNFFLSRRFVFGVYWQNWLAQYTVFTMISLNTLLANLGLLKLLVDDASWDAITARLVSAGCVALLSFTGHKLYSFSSQPITKRYPL
jgi:putative flippase GtrA